MKRPDYFIIIPSKSSDWLSALFDSIKENVAIIIIDGGLKSRHHAERHNTSYLQGKEPFIFAQAINQGIDKAFSINPNADIIVMNDDTEIYSYPFFEMLRTVSLIRPEVGIVSPKINGVCGNPNQKNPPYPLYDETKTTLAFICCYIKNIVFKNIGKLDERFVGYGYEDEDFCLRTRKAGFKTIITSDALIQHQGSASFNKYLPLEEFRNKYNHNHDLFNAKWEGKR